MSPVPAGVGGGAGVPPFNRWEYSKNSDTTFGHYDPEKRRREREAETERRRQLKREGQRLGGKVKNRLYCPECGAKVDGRACGFCAALDGGSV